MQYYGFCVRDYLILDNFFIPKDGSVLEIGTGLGSLSHKLIKKSKEYYGVDIAPEAIDYLAGLYQDNKSAKFFCADVCADSNLNKNFDIIVSADTLEHVKSPKKYFSFIQKHLKPEGIAIVVFPNESESRHHGISWFINYSDLIKNISFSGLQTKNIYEVIETNWNKKLRSLFWDFPKSFLSQRKSDVQIFDKTEAFELIKGGGIKKELFSLYAGVVMLIAPLFSLYNYKNIAVEDDIVKKNLMLILKHK